jgi:hypothetical protein
VNKIRWILDLIRNLRGKRAGEDKKIFMLWLTAEISASRVLP